MQGVWESENSTVWILNSLLHRLCCGHVGDSPCLHKTLSKAFVGDGAHGHDSLSHDSGGKFLVLFLQVLLFSLKLFQNKKLKNKIKFL